MYIFKGRVRSMSVDGSGYSVTFEYTDKIAIQKQTFGVAYNLNGGNENVICQLTPDKEFSVIEKDKPIADFISQHSREILEISYEDNAIKKVKLSYE